MLGSSSEHIKRAVEPKSPLCFNWLGIKYIDPVTFVDKTRVKYEQLPPRMNGEVNVNVLRYTSPVGVGALLKGDISGYLKLFFPFLRKV